MKYILNFKQLSKNNVAIAGGKGASLGEMASAGFPVPPGFVVSASAFDRFLEETDLNVEIDSILHSVDHRKMHTVEDASEKIKALILNARMSKVIADEIQKFFKKLNSKFVAVRSSATAEDSLAAAWAGQLSSYLNTTEINLLKNVKKCWASLFTPRAIFYRFEKKLHEQKISVAVVVQKMIESEVSGVAFSVHPVTQDKNQLIIEAGFGLGEAIVSGQITPDSYVVEKQPRRIIDKNVQTQSRGLYRAEKGGNEWRNIPKEKGEKQVLSDKEILELSEIILRIENHYGFPVDVEWAAEKGKFYIVQSRPITTLTDQNQVQQKYRFEIEKGEQDENGLKGQIAYQGKVSGKVRIVERTDQAEKVVDGEIIVSPMTTPDFVQTMKKAAAIVTDEGGITCHAAIIAREMKKPCIIGTKVATKVLKDGDLVEVDADKGIVRKIGPTTTLNK